MDASRVWSIFLQSILLFQHLTASVLDAAATGGKKSLASRRQRREGPRECTHIRCPADQYCDPGVRECSSCRNLCEYHTIQGTTDQCMDWCPGWETGEDKEEDETGGESDLTLTNILTIACIALLSAIALMLTGLAVRYRQKVFQKCVCLTTTREEDKKMPVPCSQEGENDIINSKTPLTKQTGPVVQEIHYPQAETTGQEYTRNLGEEMGFPEIVCAYRVMDGPNQHSTVPKATC